MDKWEEAKEMYIDGAKIEEISESTGIDKSSLYRRKKKEEWDELKKLSELSPEQIGKIMTESIKAVVMEIKKNPVEMMTPAKADMVIKYISAIKKFDKTVDYLGIAGDVMEEITKTIKEEYPQHMKMWQVTAERVYERLEAKWGGKA